MRGIILSASGERYVEAAARTAQRSAKHNGVPHAVFCSHPGTMHGIDAVSFAPSGNPHLDKISNMLASPFEETIYIDVDCQIVEPITELFDLLEGYELAAAHAPGYRGIADPEVPTAFYEINTGVVAYRRSDRVSALLANWRDTYRAWLAEPPFPGADGRQVGQDQPAFRRCLWKSRLPIYVLGPEYNWRFFKPSFLCGKAKVIHGFVTDPDLVAARINPPPLRARVHPSISERYGIDSEVDAAEVIGRLTPIE